MYRATYSLSYHMVSEWRPVFQLGEMISAGGSQKPQPRPVVTKSLLGSLLKPITELWWALTEHWIPRTEKSTRKGRKRKRNGHWTARPRFMTFWRCGRAAKTYLLHGRNLVLKTRSCQQWDTFQTHNRSSKYPGHSFNVMVRLHSNSQKDFLCHQPCLQRTSLEDELKYWMSTKSDNSTVIQSKVRRIAHLKRFCIPNIGSTGMETWIIQMTAKTIAQQTLNLI